MLVISEGSESHKLRPQTDIASPELILYSAEASSLLYNGKNLQESKRQSLMRD